MTNFDLQKPSYVPDNLDDATTNDSIEIEIVEDTPPFDNFHPLNAIKISPRWADGSKRMNWNI